MQRSGFREVARNVRTKFGELDLLVRRRRLYVAVEVKTRSHMAAPEAVVTDADLQRRWEALRRLAPHLRPRPRALRVDVVAVALTERGPALRHFPGQAVRLSRNPAAR